MHAIRLLVCSFLLVCAVSWAQTSQVNGTIKDSTGLAIPGAAIKATQTATGAVRTTTSGADGDSVKTFAVNWCS